ncbi:MAG: hypothetical protein AB7N54_06690 [Alphaproteobacteria bacterium]
MAPTAARQQQQTGSARGQAPMRPEAQLCDYVEQLRLHRKDRRAVHIHLSALQRDHRKGHHIRMAADTFNHVVKLFEGAIFVLSNDDIIVFANGARIRDIDEAVLKVRYLFSEDPLAHDEDDEQEEAEPGRFCTWYDVTTQYDELCTLAAELRRVAELPPAERAAIEAEAAARVADRRAGADARARPHGPLTLAELVNIEEAIATLDLAPMMRRQPVCAITRGAAPQHVLDEVFVAIDELERVVTPRRPLTSDKWLFRRFTHTLDRRMMVLITRIEGYTPPKFFSLNLNVSTLLSPEFVAFDNALRSGARGTIMIELSLVDVFSDMAAYAFARDFVRDRGYKVCIDGLSCFTAGFVDRERLGADMMKVAWTKDMLEDVSGQRRATLADTVRRAGPARVILCHCDGGDAIEVGRGVGISLFQGHWVDRLLAETPGLARAAG